MSTGRWVCLSSCVVLWSRTGLSPCSSGDRGLRSPSCHLVRVRAEPRSGCTLGSFLLTGLTSSALKHFHILISFHTSQTGDRQSCPHFTKREVEAQSWNWPLRSQGRYDGSGVGWAGMGELVWWGKGLSLIKTSTSDTVLLASNDTVYAGRKEKKEVCSALLALKAKVTNGRHIIKCHSKDHLSCCWGARARGARGVQKCLGSAGVSLWQVGGTWPVSPGRSQAPTNTSPAPLRRTAAPRPFRTPSSSSSTPGPLAHLSSRRPPLPRACPLPGAPPAPASPQPSAPPHPLMCLAELGGEGQLPS